MQGCYRLETNLKIPNLKPNPNLAARFDVPKPNIKPSNLFPKTDLNSKPLILLKKRQAKAV